MYVKNEVKEERKDKHQGMSSGLTRCVVLCDSEGVKGGSGARAVGEKSNPQAGQLWGCVSARTWRSKKTIWPQVFSPHCKICEHPLTWHHHHPFSVTEARSSCRYVLCEKGGQAPVHGGGVHVSVLVGQQQRALGLLLKQISAGFHEGLFHIAVEVGVLQPEVSAGQTQAAGVGSRFLDCGGFGTDLSDETRVMQMIWNADETAARGFHSDSKVGKSSVSQCN